MQYVIIHKTSVCLLIHKPFLLDILGVRCGLMLDQQRSFTLLAHPHELSQAPELPMGNNARVYVQYLAHAKCT